MPKGEGSPAIFRLSPDALEERLLLSHPTVASVHIISSASPVQVATSSSVGSRTDVDSTHSTTSTASDVMDRDADQVAAAALAASSSSADQSNIPAVVSLKIRGDTEDTSTNGVILTSSRNLRVTYVDDHVAWGVRSTIGPHLETMAHVGSELSPEVSSLPLESAKNAAGEVGLVDGLVDSQVVNRDDVEAVLGQVVTRGADLLAPYLPVDRVGLEQAIDRLLDGIEVLGREITSEAVDPADLIPTPIAWGIGLAVAEIVRRQLRRKGEGDDQPDRDPALGLHESLG